MAVCLRALAACGIILFFGMASSGCEEPIVTCSNDASCDSFAAEQGPCMQGRCVLGDCIAEPRAGFCFIDGTCFQTDQSKPAEPCLVCDDARDDRAWVDKTCGPGQLCSSTGMCMADPTADVVVADADAADADASADAAGPDVPVVADVGPDLLEVAETSDADADADAHPEVVEDAVVDAPLEIAEVAEDAPGEVTVDAAPDVPTGPVNAPDPSSAAQLETLRALAPAAVTHVAVTYVRTTEGGDWPAFMVQATPEGPAVTISTGPDADFSFLSVGDIVSFDASTVVEWKGQVEVSAVQNLTVVGGDFDVAPWIQDVSNATSVASLLDNHEAELVSATGLAVADSMSPSGAGYLHWNVDLPGLAGDPNLIFRLPQALVDGIGDVGGCTVTVSGTPLTQYETAAQLSAWQAGEFTVSDCTGLRAVSAEATSNTNVLVTFHRALDPATLIADGNQFSTLLNVTSATLVSPSSVMLQTGPQAAGSPYTLSIVGITDVTGASLDPDFGSVSFMGQ